MKPTWDRIHVWLRANAPEVLATLRPGATEEAIRRAEREMGVRFPEDVRECYRIHDGTYGGSFVYGRLWHGLKEMAARSRSLRAHYRANEFGRRRIETDGRVRQEWWHPAWIPLATDDGGDFMCLDLAPGPKGYLGQVFYWYRDSGPGNLAAVNVTDWLGCFADALDRGPWAYSVHFDGLAHVEDIEDFEA